MQFRPGPVGSPLISADLGQSPGAGQVRRAIRSPQDSSCGGFNPNCGWRRHVCPPKSSLDGSGGERACWPHAGTFCVAGILLRTATAEGRASHISTCIGLCQRHQATLSHTSCAYPLCQLRGVQHPHSDPALPHSSSLPLGCIDPLKLDPTPGIVFHHPPPLRNDERWGIYGNPFEGAYAPGSRQPHPAVTLRAPVHAPWPARRSTERRATRMTCHAPVRTGGVVVAVWDLD